MRQARLQPRLMFNLVAGLVKDGFRRLSESVVAKLCINAVITSGLLVILGLYGNAYSQQGTGVSEAEVTALLAEIESANKTRAVYRIEDQLKIADVEFDSGFEVIKRQGKWSIIEFTQRSVPGWVSADYLKVSGRTGEVVASRLNFRSRPALKSDVLLQLPRGYRSRVIARRNDFVKIYAPSSFQVAIFAGTELEATAEKSNLSIEADPQSARQVAAQRTRASSDNSLNLRQVERLNVEQQPVTLSANSSELDESELTKERLHIIAPGDAVSLLVFGETDLSIENVRVPQSGRVAFPLIGSVNVAGRTIPDVEQELSLLLAQGYVRNPRLSLTMFSYRPIFIRGGVRQTGSFPFSEGLSVGKAIALAGGVKNSAKRAGVSILRDGKVIAEGLSKDSLSTIKSGDVITVEEDLGVQEDGGTFIYLHGEVATPGEYKFRRGLTVEKAIVVAGGFTLRGSRKKISITRYADKGPDEAPEKVKKVQLYTPIRPGDIINVGATWF